MPIHPRTRERIESFGFGDRLERMAGLRLVEPLGYLGESAYAALDPSRMGLGPVFATSKLLQRTGLQMSDFDLVELRLVEPLRSLRIMHYSAWIARRGSIR